MKAQLTYYPYAAGWAVVRAMPERWALALGRLGADQAELLARLAAEVQLTPWRSVVVPDLAEDAVDDAAVELHRSGMVFDAASPWLQVTTCAGRPGCAKSLADVRADAARAVADGTLPAGGARLGGRRGGAVDVPPVPAPGPVGAAPQHDGRVALVAVVPLGRLDAAQAELLARLADEVQLTPWRSIVVPDLPEGAVDDAAVALHRTGMVFDAASPWTRVTACAGRPGCAKSLADVRADAVRAVATGTLPADGARQHWAGCERRCGRPQGEVVDVVATGTGYRVGKG